MKLAIAYDEAFLDHVEHGHPERPERLIAIKDALQEAGYWDEDRIVPPREATEDELRRIHDDEYVQKTLKRLEQGYGHLDPDTYFSSGSRLAALRASGGAIDVSRRVWTRDDDIGLALVRPPGHHAEAYRAAGFCIFNNIAIAAASLLEDGAERVMVFDWDVHHGNGTQHEFEHRKDLFYISVHAWPHYPGTGLSHEIGKGEGEGFTANVPFPHGANDVAYADVMDRLVIPLARAYRPDILLVSAGFDAHRNDLLGGMAMTEAGYGYLAAVMRDLANELCDGRLVLFLEGGYDLKGISASMVEVIRTIDSSARERPEGETNPRHAHVIDETIEHLQKFWPSLE